MADENPDIGDMEDDVNSGKTAKVFVNAVHG